MGMVYQNPRDGLNFSFTSGGNIAEKLLMAGTFHVGNIRGRASYLLTQTEVPVQRMDETPASFSGGMQQRVQISKAIANNPPLVFLDEVTSGLDVSVQARVLDLIRRLQHELGISMIVVSHDLGVIRMLTDRTIVLKHGRIVEHGLTDQILQDPQHAYTQLLVSFDDVTRGSDRYLCLDCLNDHPSFGGCLAHRHSPAAHFPSMQALSLAAEIYRGGSISQVISQSTPFCRAALR